jgi:SAM-dependent methyltransferase
VTDEASAADAADDAASDDPHRADFVARIYDGEHQGESADIAWGLRLARALDGPIADLGCGTGRLTLPLAAAGRPVLALDRSAAMLGRLKAKLGRHRQSVQQLVEIKQADLTQWISPCSEFALAVIGYNTFAALLTADDQMRCLTAVRVALRPGGRLAIATAAVSAQVVGLPDGFSREVYRRPAPELGSHVELIRRDIQRWTDETRQIRQLALVYDVHERDAGRRQFQYEFAARYTSRWELEHLLARCGFADVRVRGGYDEEPFSVAGGLMVVTATREDS